MDRELHIIGANQASLASAGRAEADLLGRYVFDAFPENPDDPGSTNLAEVRESLLRAIATGETDTTVFWRYAVPRETPAGTVFDERFWRKCIRRCAAPTARLRSWRKTRSTSPTCTASTAPRKPPNRASSRARAPRALTTLTGPRCTRR